MRASATFADLPVELAERVILVISHRWTVEDKPSLANLARASRAIHRLVQPILVRSVVMTDSNVSKIRAVAHLFRSTRVLIIQDPDFAPLASSDFYRCTTSFPSLNLYVGPLTPLYALMRYINPVRIVTSTLIELDHLFSIHINFQQFSRLTHLRISTFMVSPVSIRRASLLVTHLFLDLEDLNYEDDVEEEHARVAKALATLLVLARLPKLERVCVRPGISDSARAMALRKGLESYPALQGETRLWLAVSEDEYSEFMDPYEDEYWLVGSQVHCG